MTAAIRIDPQTGRKIFNTRAAKATEKIAGKGYSEIEDDAPGMKAIEVHELLGALRYERYAADHPYIQCGLKDKAVLLNRFRLPEEGRLCMAAD